MLTRAQRGKIEYAAGRERVQRTAGVGHGHRDDGREQQPRKARGHFTNKKKWQDAVGALTRREQRCVLRENEKQHTDQQENCKLKENDDATGQKRAAAIALIARRKQPLNNRLI